MTAETLAEYVQSKNATVLDLGSGTGLVGDQVKCKNCLFVCVFDH